MQRFFSLITIVLLSSVFARGADLPQPARAFLEARCVECHDADTKKGGLDLHTLSTQLDDAPTEAKWTYIFDRVQRGEMPPKKQKQPPAGEVSTFIGSLGGFLAGHDASRHSATGRVPWRRLNRVEYENTVHDLLAIETPLVALLPEDGAAYGFDNVSEALRLSATQIDCYMAAADAALDTAINFGPKPEVKKTRFVMLNRPQIRQALEKPTGSLNKDGGRYACFFRAVPDGLVVFINGLWECIMRELHADVAGDYRVRLSAYSYQSEGRPTVVAKVMFTDFVHTRPGATFDLTPGKPREMECTLRFAQNEMVFLNSTGCNFMPDGTVVENIGGETYPGTGMVVQWIEMEGPLLASWPPPSMHRVFGDVPINPIEKPKRREIAYEVATANPAKDVDTLVTAFARRAFRRPVTESDTAPYLQLAHEALSEGGTLEAAVRRAYKAILVSPKFLFLQETTGTLDNYALASRLAYFLWSTPPDDELLKLAAEGKLHDPATLRAQTERLLASPKAHAFTRNFCGQWLNLRSIAATTPDQGLYPEFDDILQRAMVDETEAFFEDLMHEDLGVAMLIDSNFAMLNRRLAEHYGIPGVVGEQIRKVMLPAGSHRGGLLTQASILKVTANGTLSSPVIRGNWVLKRLLGRVTPPPPADAGSIEPDTRGATTIREQLAKHRRNASCNACHQYMDPPGFALENYDVIGGWRDGYRTLGPGKQEIDPITNRGRNYRIGAPVDPAGELADGRRFTSIDELKKLLLDQQDAVAQKLVNNLVTYSTGAGVTFADRAKVDEILARAKTHSYGLRTLVHEVVQSTLFQSK